MKTIFSFSLLFLAVLSLPSFSRCSDYSTKEEVIKAYKSGETDLDRDGDCYACESTINAYVCGTTKKTPKATKTNNKKQVEKKER